MKSLFVKNGYIYFICFISFLIPSVCFAQVAMNLELNKQDYIQYEKIYARVTIKNQTGRPIVFGENKELKGKISFDIQTISGSKPDIIAKPSYQIEDKLLKAGEKETFIIPLTAFFKFAGEGKYRVKAIVSHFQLPEKYESNQVVFDIVHANVVWSTIVGIPSAGEKESKAEKIKERTYSILSYFDGKDKLYYLKVEDKNFIYGLARLGIDMGTKLPECQIDDLSRIHILLQASPDTYCYFVYDINCKLETRCIYKQLPDTSVRLFKDDKTGRITVAGGVRE